MSYLTDRKRVDGLGSAHSGVGHWMSQRMTAIALIPLSLLFLFPFIAALGADHSVMLETYAHPRHALIAMMFFTVLCLHLYQGIQVVIEDYVHGHLLRISMLVMNKLFWGATAVTAVFAIAKIAFSA
ncbi:MAG: succinate dehydrogenase, hydrophobic membrane anchor protein [Marinosulfonomonas sp.]|nr:succinate dehydrogenase, hydrophobic membrane anchor protein [Marinosulfonomonas sp.]